MKDAVIYVREDHTLWGVNAEILSVLSDSALWPGILTETRLTAACAALDTSRTAEERIGPADVLIREFVAESRIGKWIPRYSNLAHHEYKSDFYPGYRDHSIHSLQVFLLGLYLYETCTPLCSALHSHLSTAVASILPPEELFLEWWTIASLWHDLGYPLEADGVASSPERVNEILEQIRDDLDSQWFSAGHRQLWSDDSPQLLRKLERAARFHGYDLFSLGDILPSHDETENPVEDLWIRLLPDSHPRPLVTAIDRATTHYSLAPRPGYHDHGLMGGLLLWRLYEQSLQALERLGEGTAKDLTLKNSAFDRLLDEWHQLTRARPLVKLAAEAIAYHNLDFGSLDQQLWSSELGVGERPAAALSTEPHLFFLGLCDTLQDWDRHHFVPNYPNRRYRPSLPSRDFLLQGDNNYVRVGFRKDDRGVARSSVIRLLSAWLDQDDVEDLIKSKPGYSRPALLQATAEVKLEELSTSRRALDQLSASLESAIESADRCLNSRDSLGLFRAVNLIDSVLQDFDARRDELLPGDVKRFKSRLDSPDFRELEISAYAKFRTGVPLSRGKVDRSIGKGGFGEVFLVRIENGATQVFKRYHVNDLGDAEKRRLFERGHRAMRKLAAHPRVVDVYELLKVPFGFFMQYVNGPDLHDGAAGVSDPWARILMAKQIAETVAFAHGQGVLHRDIKPANILLDYSGGAETPLPVLTDFDLAWIDGRSSSTEEQYATLKYGAPELHEKKWAHHRRTPSVDVYGLGALLFFLLVGDDPPTLGHYATEDRQRFETALQDRVPATVLVDLWDLIQACSERNPTKRTTTVEDIVDVLVSCHSRRIAGDAPMTWNDWVSQIKYLLAHSSAAIQGDQVASVTGGVVWHFSPRFDQVTKQQALVAAASMSTMPSMEGVNYDGFRKAARRQVDGYKNRFNSRNFGGTVRRSGMLGTAGSSMELVFPAPKQTLQSADAFSNLLASITRAVG